MRLQTITLIAVFAVGFLISLLLFKKKCPEIGPVPELNNALIDSMLVQRSIDIQEIIFYKNLSETIQERYKVYRISNIQRITNYENKIDSLVNLTDAQSNFYNIARDSTWRTNRATIIELLKEHYGITRPY